MGIEEQRRKWVNDEFTSKYNQKKLSTTKKNRILKALWKKVRRKIK